MNNGDFEKLKGWNINDSFIEKEFVFQDFSRAIGFIVAVSIRAEKINHHPEIYNVYNKVILKLTTHDTGELTHLDFKLAAIIDSIEVT